MNGEKQIDEQVQGAVETAKAKKTGGDKSESRQVRRRQKKKSPFKADETGTYRRVEFEKPDGSTGTKWERFASEMHAIAYTRNEDGERWGLWLEIVDRDNIRHLWNMPNAMLMGTGEALRNELANYGFELATGRNPRNWLLEYLVNAQPTQKVRTATRIGWHGKIFLLPDEAIGPNAETERVILQSEDRLSHAFNKSRTSEEWRKHVAAKAVGNSRLVLSICVGLAAPLLAIAEGEEGGGFHFRGGSSTGKSTALIIGGSLWGGGGLRGYIRTYRITANGAEGMCELHCDTLLCIDELNQISPVAAGELAYMISQGEGKQRAGREGQARSVRLWRVLFLSNGEIGLADKVKEGGGRDTAGMGVRMIDIRADAGAGMGIFENIHEAKDPATFSQDLKDAASKYYGTVAREWVKIIAQDPENIRSQIARLWGQFVNNEKPNGCDGQVSRVVKRFALIAAAGELATAEGITGWEAGEAINAAQRCFKDWVRERGGIGSSEVADAKQRIEEAIQVGGSANFQRWYKSSSDRIQVPHRQGFVRIEGKAEEEELEYTYYFLPHPLKTLLSGLDTKSVIPGLMKLGVIVPQDGKPNKTYSVPTFSKSQRLYEISLEALGKDFPDDF